MYNTLRLLFRSPLPFLSIFAAIPIFFKLPKTILYDPLAQFFTACTLYLMAVFYINLYKKQQKGNKFLIWPFLIGFFITTTVLSKQPTGIGLLCGVLVVFLLLLFEFKFKEIICYFGAVFAGLICGFLLWMLFLSPFISISGMIQDVFIAGSEPKGGIYHVIQNFVNYPIRYAKQLDLSKILFGLILFLSLLRYRFFPRDNNLLLKKYNLGFIWNLKKVLLILGIVLLVVIIKTFLTTTEQIVVGRINLWTAFILWAGWFGLILLILDCFFSKIFSLKEKIEFEILGVLGIAALFTAFFHNLSSDYLRWSYDNNPLIIIVFAFIFFAVIYWPLNRIKFLSFAFVIFISIISWISFVPHLHKALACTERWPEVNYLKGANLRPASNGMRELVSRIKDITAKDDKVLLLPSDPNVESWFNRPRPELNTALIFTDQYWDKYVEDDLVRLEQQLPKIIIIGPRKRWLSFSRQWNAGKGSDRFIGLVKQEIIPRYYELYESQLINLANIKDHMDIYVRKDN